MLVCKFKQIRLNIVHFDKNTLKLHNVTNASKKRQKKITPIHIY